MELRITIKAKIRGSVDDAKAYGAALAKNVEKALDDEQGPDLDVHEVKIERKLDGYEKIG